MILLGISYVWNRTHKGFGESTFITSQIFHSLSLLMVLSFDIPVNEDFGRPFVFLLGVAFYTLLVKKYKINWFWSLVSLMTLGFYTSLYVTLDIQEPNETVTFLFLAPVVLLAVADGLGKKVKGLRPYFMLSAIAFYMHP